ncbi:MAG: hypothetical protein KDB22_01995 [Planctomycetales bacterium]|nr:hypothetical protein [Planctomycetales bacterium]
MTRIAPTGPLTKIEPSRVSRRLLTATALVVVWMGIVTVASAVESTEVSASDALDVIPNGKWYDSTTKNFVAPVFPPQADNPIRSDGWTKQANNQEWDWQWPDWLDWSGQASQATQVGLMYLLAVILGSILLAIVATIVWYGFRDYLPNRGLAIGKKTSVEIDPTRIVDLPFEVQSGIEDPLGEARRRMATGDYDSAIVFLYGYLLLALDRQRFIHLQKGKTNRMYLREMAASLRLREIVLGAMLAFEESFFGKHRLTQVQFQAVWQHLDEFHQLVAAAAAKRVEKAEVQPA